LYATVIGAEVCGPEFTPDNKTLFLAIQHPGEGGIVEKPSILLNKRSLPHIAAYNLSFQAHS